MATVRSDIEALAAQEEGNHSEAQDIRTSILNSLSDGELSVLSAITAGFSGLSTSIGTLNTNIETLISLMTTIRDAVGVSSRGENILEYAHQISDNTSNIAAHTAGMEGDLHALYEDWLTYHSEWVTADERIQSFQGDAVAALFEISAAAQAQRQAVIEVNGCDCEAPKLPSAPANLIGEGAEHCRRVQYLMDLLSGVISDLNEGNQAYDGIGQALITGVVGVAFVTDGIGAIPAAIVASLVAAFYALKQAGLNDFASQFDNPELRQDLTEALYNADSPGAAKAAWDSTIDASDMNGLYKALYKLIGYQDVFNKLYDLSGAEWDTDGYDGDACGEDNVEYIATSVPITSRDVGNLANSNFPDTQFAELRYLVDNATPLNSGYQLYVRAGFNEEGDPNQPSVYGYTVQTFTGVRVRVREPGVSVWCYVSDTQFFQLTQNYQSISSSSGVYSFRSTEDESFSIQFDVNPDV